MRDWCVVVPLIEEPEMTHKARAMHDAPVLYIDNTPDGAYGGDGRNLGVAASWNEGLRRGHDWTLVLSSSVVLPKGLRAALAQLDEVIDAGERWAVFTEEAMHAFALSRATVEEVGYFDEQFYPAYFEDNDWLYRMKLAGLQDRPKIDIGAGSYVPHRIARALKRGIVSVDFDKLRDLYRAKWGGPPGEERFTVPYDGARVG